MIYFTGIGSRTISEVEIYKIQEVSKYLNTITDITVISGNAPGADITWQKYNKHIAMLPWKKFNFENFIPEEYYILKDTDKAYLSIDKWHPNPYSLNKAAKKLMARNYYQVIPTPYKILQTNFIIYIANEDNKGNVSGGTGQAIRIAKDKGIPYFNLRNHSIEECIDWIDNWLLNTSY